jgi:5-methylcytosine-specific restriction endonuclease McrA
LFAKFDSERKFYDSPAWRKIRKKALERDRYACMLCKERGSFTRANTVHHIQELKNAPHLALTLSNLQSLCHACHDKIHAKGFSPPKREKRKFPERW